MKSDDTKAIWKRSRLSGETCDGAPHPDGNRAHRRAMLAKGRTAQRQVSRGRERLKAAVAVVRAR